MAQSSDKKPKRKIGDNNRVFKKYNKSKYLNFDKMAEVVIQDPIYIHHNPNNFIKTYETLKLENELINIEKNQLERLKEARQIFETDSKRVIQIVLGEGNLDKARERLTETTKDIRNEKIFLPKRLTLSEKGKNNKTDVTDKDKLKEWASILQAFINKAQSSLDNFANLTKENKDSYQFPINDMIIWLRHYNKLIDDDKIDAAYEFIKSSKGAGKWVFRFNKKTWKNEELKTLPIRTAQGKGFEPLEAEIMKTLGDNIDVLLTGSDNKLTDYAISANGESIGVNLKISDTSYNIDRAITIQDCVTDEHGNKNDGLINTYFYVYYNYSVFSNMREKSWDMWKINRALIKSMTYEGLRKIFIGEWEDYLPIFISFRGEFFPTIQAIDAYIEKTKNSLGKEEGDLVASFDKFLFDRHKLWEEKKKVLKKYKNHVWYVEMYEEVKKYLPHVFKDKGVTYTFYITKDTIKGK